MVSPFMKRQRKLLSDISDGEQPVKSIYAEGSPTVKAQDSMNDVVASGVNTLTKTADNFAGGKGTRQMLSSIGDTASGVVAGVKEDSARQKDSLLHGKPTNMARGQLSDLNEKDDAYLNSEQGARDLMTKKNGIQFSQAPVEGTPAGMDKLMAQAPMIAAQGAAQGGAYQDPAQSERVQPLNINDPNNPLTNSDIDGKYGLKGIDEGRKSSLNPTSVSGVPDYASMDFAPARDNSGNASASGNPTWDDMQKQWQARQPKGRIVQQGPKLYTRENAPNMNWMERKSLNEVNLKAYHDKGINTANNKAGLETNKMEERGLNARSGAKSEQERAKANTLAQASLAKEQRKMVADNAKNNKLPQPEWVKEEYDKKGDLEKGTGYMRIPKGWRPELSDSAKRGKPTDQDTGWLRFLSEHSSADNDFTSQLEQIKKNYGL